MNCWAMNSLCSLLCLNKKYTLSQLDNKLKTKNKNWLYEREREREREIRKIDSHFMLPISAHGNYYKRWHLDNKCTYDSEPEPLL